MDKKFINPENLNTIYEILIELNFDGLSDILKQKDKNIISKINTLFMLNINFFYEKNLNNNDSLFDLNKNFILFMTNKNTFSLINEKNEDKIDNNEVLITNNDIKNYKINDFENNLRIKKNDFEKINTIVKPSTPIFKDNYEDIPLKNIDLNKLIMKRNEEIKDFITENNTKNNIENDNKVYLKILDENLNNEIINQNIIELNNSKHVSWIDDENENIKYYIENKEEKKEKITNHFFKKFKIKKEDEYEIKKDEALLYEVKEYENIKDDVLFYGAKEYEEKIIKKYIDEIKLILNSHYENLKLLEDKIINSLENLSNDIELKIKKLD
jgi:hypothetical protein